MKASNLFKKKSKAKEEQRAAAEVVDDGDDGNGGNDDDDDNNDDDNDDENNYEGLVLTNLDTQEVVHAKSPSALAESVKLRASSTADETISALRRGSFNSSRFGALAVDGEFNSDPQWRIFLDYYARLVAQEKDGDDTTGGGQYNLDEPIDLEKESKSLLSLLTQALGDLSSITVPITYLEPTSFLQRLAESLRYAALLDAAARSTDSSRRMALVAAFFVSGHASNRRTTKPFNPLLGETFEFVMDDANHREARGCTYKFFAEQVSHHPPIAASHAHNELWELWDEKRVSSKFGGNHLNVKPQGTFHLKLKINHGGNGGEKKTTAVDGDDNDYEYYTFDPVLTTAHNIIVGSMWVDHHGDTDIINHTNGFKCKLRFEKCGWLSKNRYKFAGDVKDASGATQLQLVGSWNEYVKIVDSDELWRVAEDVGDDGSGQKRGDENRHLEKYDFTDYTRLLLRIDDARKLPATDSRLRPDRLLLEKGDTKRAAAAKKTMEEKQRLAKRMRLSTVDDDDGGGGGGVWVPRFFVPERDMASDEVNLDDIDPHAWLAIEHGQRYWRLQEERARLNAHLDALQSAADKKVEKRVKKKKKKSALGGK